MNIDFKISRRNRRDENGEVVEKLPFHCFKGNSSTQSNPNNSQTVTDNRVAASDGSSAATNGSSVTNNNISPDIIKSNNDALFKVAEQNANIASESIQEAGKTARDLTYTAVSGNVDVSKSALQTAGNAVSDSLNFGAHVYDQSVSLAKDANDNLAQSQKDALGFAQNAQMSANELIQRTNDSFTAKLASNAGIAPTSAADNMVKYVTIAAAVIGLGIAFAQRNKN